jgi:hypothetical protein
MATKASKKTKTKKSNFDQYFSQSHQGYHLMGKEYRDLFNEAVGDYFKRFKHHVYIAGQPGVGKTWTVEHMAEQYPDMLFVVVKQGMTPWAFMKLVAVSAWKAKMSGKRLGIYIDDFNAIFKANSEFLDMFKNAMDKKSGDRIEYNKSLQGQYDSAEDIEKQAIDYWKAQDPDRTGFVVKFEGNVKFIFTMNTPLPGAQEVAKFKVGSEPWIKSNNRNAIRTRTKYEDLVMSKEVYWGWIADVLWNEPEICVGATDDQKFEMLMWMWDNWEKASGQSLRFIEEDLWDIMERFPKRQDYLKRWEKLKG